MFVIGIRYLMGWAAATDIAKRNPPEEPEWPVHPGRVFMALAAAHFETPWDEQHSTERQALEWLEAQPSPELIVPRGEPRSPVTCYVPVNDQQGLEALPSRRSKQARSFPRMILDDETVTLIWSDVEVPEEYRAALEAVCSKVTRIGHSSSLAQVWIRFDSHESNSIGTEHVGERWVRTPNYQRSLRVASPGTLANLSRWFNAEAVEGWADLQARVATAKGTEKRALKTEIQNRFGNRMPRSQRPILRATEGYARVKTLDAQEVVNSVFDDDLLVLRKVDGPNLGMESTVALMTALRGTILSQFRSEAETPAWISGHDADGRPLQEPHLALIPLGYVGSEYADGHLLGAALVFPRRIPPRERAESLRPLFQQNDDGAWCLPELKLGRLGEWKMEREIRSFPAQALKSETWTEPRRTWGTVTPIVLDRYPKADRLEDRKAWEEEVARIIASSCRNIGLPEPVQIDIEKSSWHLGSPRAMPGKTGFPLYPIRSGHPCRVQVHAWLRFEQLVQGPVILGAGRYLGYGLCKPLPERKAASSTEADA